MANNFVEHKDRWLQIANGEFDYSIMFIKSWLPFNAWYCNNYPELNNSDRRILTEVKNDDNLFKTRIISLLEGTNDDAAFFREKLANLHAQLDICRVPNVDNCITFSNINFRTNPTTVFTKTYRRSRYKIEYINPALPPNHYKVKLDRVNSSNNTTLTYSHTKYDINHLKNNSDYISLADESKRVIDEGFKLINPKLKESLIVSKKRDSLPTINSVMLTKDTDLLSQAIIEILYRIRCILFHGEIQPSKDNLKIYEPAFYMLRLLIKSLV